jgi:hypothetical protein
MHLCLGQVEIMDIEAAERKKWISKTLWFLLTHIRLAKATRTTEPRRMAKLSIQLWGFEDTAPAKTKKKTKNKNTSPLV